MPTRIAICLVVVFSAAVGRSLGEQAEVEAVARLRAMALRSARVDAVAKLQAQVRDLPVTDRTRVGDLLDECPPMHAGLTAFLAGAREASRPAYQASGACEAAVKVSTRHLVAELQELLRRHYTGRKARPTDFEGMAARLNAPELAATGQGRPVKESWEIDLPFSPVEAESDLADRRHMLAGSREFWEKHCTGSDRAVALGRARTDAQRRLAEQVRSLPLAPAYLPPAYPPPAYYLPDASTEPGSQPGTAAGTADLTVADLIAASDRPGTDPAEFLAARCTGVRYRCEDLIVEVKAQAALKDIYSALATWAARHYKGDWVTSGQLDQAAGKAGDRVLTAVGLGSPPVESVKDPTPEIVAVLRLAGQTPPWATGAIRAVGTGEAAGPAGASAPATEARAGAESDAVRKLARRLCDLRLTANTTVFDLARQDAAFARGLAMVQQSGRIVEGSPKAGPEAAAQVEVELDLGPLWDLVIYCVRTEGLVIK